MTELISPYGGGLVDLTVPDHAREELRSGAAGLPSLQISERSLCDLELLATGGFSPLDRFMSRADHDRVLREMRLVSGHLFPIPVALPIAHDARVALDREIALRDSRNNLVATMVVEEIYQWSPAEVARLVLGTEDSRHPLVAEMGRWGGANVSGPLRLIELPRRYDFQELRLTPLQCRARLRALGRANVVAFQTRNPLHRVHEELTKRAAAQIDGVVLLHPAVGMTKPGDVDHYTRVRTYQALARGHYAPDRILLALLPLAMRLAGPREALWHALIRRNYGANHLIVGRDHASPGLDSAGQPFHGPYDAQELVRAHETELGVRMIPFRELVYLPEEGRYEEAAKVPAGARALSLSGTDARERFLDRGESLPEWFTRPEVARILAEAYPPPHRRGACIWFTGLSGAGKTTTAEILTSLVLELGRQVTVLDGDVVRTHLSRGLGFSREDRDTNIRRMGFVASEIVRHGGLVICAAVSPYRSTRNEIRELMPAGRFIEVFVDTPLATCEARDSKGMYAKARRGEIPGFTGIDDPYERPLRPEITLETIERSAEENAMSICTYLQERGFMSSREIGIERDA